jgi:hypothetical protein
MSTDNSNITASSIQRNESYLLWGISIYCFGLLVPMFYQISYFGALLNYIGLILMILAFNGLPYSCFPKNGKFVFIFKLYFFWSVIIFIRGFLGLTDFRDFMFYLIEYKFGPISFVILPAAVMFGTNIFFYKKLFKWIYAYAIAFIVMSFLFVLPILNSSFSWAKIYENTGIVENLNKSLFLPASFGLLTIYLQNRKIKISILIAFVLALIISVFFARRNLIFSVGLAVIFTAILYTFSRTSKKVKFLYIFIFTVFLAVSSSLITDNLSSDKFKFITLKMDEDITYSREGVETEMLNDFAYSPFDYIWGRGGNGTYYSTLAGELEGGQRRSMETGYLALILKGGLIYLLLHLLILVFAVYKGLFRSNNKLIKAAALFILIAILELGPAGCNRATLYSLMTWFLVGMCYSPEIRNMDNKTIKAFIIN